MFSLQSFSTLLTHQSPPDTHLAVARASPLVLSLAVLGGALGAVAALLAAAGAAGQRGGRLAHGPLSAVVLRLGGPLRARD